MKTIIKLVVVLIAVLSVVSCADQKSRTRAVYMLVDTSGTYTNELDKAQRVINYLLGTMNPGDSLAVARVKSRSFTEKDIVAKVTFAKDPLKANGQKHTFRQKMSQLAQQTKKGSAYTDITGGLIQGAEFLNETGAGRKTILIFSDMQEELDKKTIRDIPIDLAGIRIIALNVTKLDTDNRDPRRYLGRLEQWEQRVRKAGASDWRVVNDLDHMERMFES